MQKDSLKALFSANDDSAHIETSTRICAYACDCGNGVPMGSYRELDNRERVTECCLVSRLEKCQDCQYSQSVAISCPSSFV